MIKEAVLYDPLVENRVKCNVCAHRCTIPEGKVGVCRTRNTTNPMKSK